VPNTHKELAVAETDGSVVASQEERLAEIAERSLDFFEDAAGAAREALGEDRRPGANVLAVVNAHRGQGRAKSGRNE
jgi:hypothetical protein